MAGRSLWWFDENPTPWVWSFDSKTKERVANIYLDYIQC